MDDLRSQIRLKNLPERFQEVLAEFKGDLEGWEPTTRTTTSGQSRAFTVVILRFVKVDVIEATEPYSFPTATVEIPHGGKDSRWGIFALSLAPFLNEDEDSLDPLIGKRFHMKRTPGHSLWNSREGKRMEQSAWEVLNVEGRTPGTASSAQQANPLEAAREAALTHLQGHTAREFNIPALKDSRIRGTEVQRLLLAGTLLPKLEELGVVTKDADGRYSIDEALGAQWIVGAI